MWREYIEFKKKGELSFETKPQFLVKSSKNSKQKLNQFVQGQVY